MLSDTAYERGVGVTNGLVRVSSHVRFAACELCLVVGEPLAQSCALGAGLVVTSATDEEGHLAVLSNHLERSGVDLAASATFVSCAVDPQRDRHAD